MITNKQSKKQGDSIRVIEDKTPKTLTKKENKMNKSLNKTIKSNSLSKSTPSYKLQENSYLTIDLPNGMDLRLYASNDGKYCSLKVCNHKKSNFNTKIEKRTDEYKWGNVEKVEITHDNYGDDKNSMLNIELNNFILNK